MDKKFFLCVLLIVICNQAFAVSESEELIFDRIKNKICYEEEKTNEVLQYIKTEITKNKNLLHMVDKESGYTLLFYAINRDNNEIIRLLLDNGSDVNKTVEEGSLNKGAAPLHIAIDSKNINTDIISTLIASGANIDAIVDNNYFEEGTPLCLAIKRKRHDIVRILLDKNANTKTVIKHGIYKGMNALHLAVMIGDIDCVKLLVNNKNIDINAVVGEKNSYDKGATSLHLSIKGKNTEMVKLLVDNGATVNVSLDNIGIYNYAKRNGTPEIIGYLVKKGAEVPPPPTKPARGRSIQVLSPLTEKLRSLNNSMNNIKTSVANLFARLENFKKQLSK